MSNIVLELYDKKKMVKVTFLLILCEENKENHNQIKLQINVKFQLWLMCAKEDWNTVPVESLIFNM